MINIRKLVESKLFAEEFNEDIFDFNQWKSEILKHTSDAEFIKCEEYYSDGERYEIAIRSDSPDWFKDIVKKQGGLNGDQNILGFWNYDQEFGQVFDPNDFENWNSLRS